MDRELAFRKAFHLASPVWLVWYWMPPDAWVGVPKDFVLAFFFFGALAIEGVRLVTGWHLPGLRDYERNRLGAYAWGAVGLAFALLLFPGELVIPTFWGMAWIDPVCWYTKRRRGYPWVPVAAYVALAAALMVLVVPLAPYHTAPLAAWRIALYAPVAAVLAVAAEAPNLRWIDDDFLMHIVPLLALAALSLFPWR